VYSIFHVSHVVSPFKRMSGVITFRNDMRYDLADAGQSRVDENKTYDRLSAVISTVSLMNPDVFN
jgi:hypothetical protein